MQLTTEQITSFLNEMLEVHDADPDRVAEKLFDHIMLAAEASWMAPVTRRKFYVALGEICNDNQDQEPNE